MIINLTEDERRSDEYLLVQACCKSLRSDYPDAMVDQVYVMNKMEPNLYRKYEHMKREHEREERKAAKNSNPVNPRDPVAGDVVVQAIETGETGEKDEEVAKIVY